nr:ABC transporter ATP-binding protein [Nannocystis sp.]
MASRRRAVAGISRACDTLPATHARRAPRPREDLRRRALGRPRPDPHHPQRLDRRPHRPQRRRQVDHPAHARHGARAQRRQHRLRRRYTRPRQDRPAPPDRLPRRRQPALQAYVAGRVSPLLRPVLQAPARRARARDRRDAHHLRSHGAPRHPAGALSKGMRQRLLIARCLLHGPRLLILDEPADGLDPRGRSDLRSILARTRERGVTVLISSHILRELDDLCDQTVILQQGKLVVAGEVADIIERYEVRRFVYQLRLLAGGPAARELLARRRVLVEAEGVEDGCETLSIQVQGGEELMADILAELCAAGVRVVTVSRVRSRLEDVYNRISDDRVA